MSRIESTMLPLGTAAPPFSLPDVVSGRTVTREQFRGRDGLLVMFICRHCPFVKHLDQALAQLGCDYDQQPLGIVAISSNDAEAHPADAPESLKQQAQEYGFVFPYLYDETQEVAQAFQAACTPDFFLFDRDFKLVYRGQFDESRPGNGVEITGKDLRAAIDAVLAGEVDGVVKSKQRPSVGCNIKWKQEAVRR